MREDLLEKSRKIFAVESIDLDILKKNREEAEKMLKENEYADVFACWNHILRNDCDNEYKVIKFVELMFSFVDYPVTVPYPFDPYDFVGYIYSKVDLEKNWDECGETFDSFVNQILENSNDLDLMHDPYYQFWRDPKIIEIAKKYGKIM